MFAFRVYRHEGNEKSLFISFIMKEYQSRSRLLRRSAYGLDWSGEVNEMSFMKGEPNAEDVAQPGDEYGRMPANNVNTAVDSDAIDEFPSLQKRLQQNRLTTRHDR